MALVERCPFHPGYKGAHPPGTRIDYEPDPISEGKQTCGDCWTVFRLAHELSPRDRSRAHAGLEVTK